ncbi:hypothetical protein KQI52_15810 [bacterium]|nr:hypothetical protein [bacterium]
MFSLLGTGCGSTGDSSQPREFTIAMTGYLMGQVGPCKCPGNPLGGFARRVAVMERDLDTKDDVLKVDTGKWVSLDPDRGVADSRITAAVLSELGTHAVNVTMRDARLGLDLLKDLQKEYKLPFVSANLIDVNSEKAIFPASKRVKLKFADGGSMDVGIVGVCRAGTNNYMPPESGLAFADPGPALLEAYKDVMDAPCVVLLCDADRGMTADWLAMLEEETGSRPSVVLSSNLHPTRSARILIGQTPMTTTGRQGKYTDIVTMVPLGEQGWDAQKAGVALNSDSPEDAKTIQLIDEILADYPELENLAAAGDEEDDFHDYKDRITH